MGCLITGESTAVAVLSVSLEALSNRSLFSLCEDSPKRSGLAGVGMQYLYELGALHLVQAWWRIVGYSGRSQDGHFGSICSAYLPRLHYYSLGWSSQRLL